MIGHSAGGFARTTRATGLLLAAIVATACGASQSSPASAPPAATLSPSTSAATTPAASPPAASPSTVLASPGISATNMVDIGGRSLYASCLGESAPGEPTVVFEHGLGGGAGAWVSTQLAVAETVRACVYARAGAGPSDPADTPRTAQDLADDLARLLDRAGIQAPYVFVSHSMGPWVTTLYTVAHPEAVVGLVFVDPRGPGVTDEWVAALPPPTAGESAALMEMRDFIAEILVDPPDNDEGLSIAASEAEVRAALAADSPLFGDTPLIVLQAGLTPNAWGDPAEPAGMAWKDAWFDGQAALAATSTAGRLDVVADSGHFIQSDAPTVVIDAILEVLGAP